MNSELTENTDRVDVPCLGSKFIKRTLWRIGVSFLLGSAWASAAFAADSLGDDCPALAKSTYNGYSLHTQCNLNPQSPWKNVCKAIYGYKPKDWMDSPSSLDSTLAVSFWEDLQQAGKGTPYCKALLKDQLAFEQKLMACGDNGPCVVRVMGDRLRQVSSIKRQFTGPQLSREDLLDFLGKDRHMPLGRGETLEERALRGLNITPLPQAFVPGNWTLNWGIEPHNAQVQTVVWRDKTGKVVALALVDGLYARGEGQTQLPKDAQIRLFLRDPQRLASLAPSLQAWAAADALGMNVDCSGAKGTACAHWSGYSMPVQAYRLPCASGNLNRCRLPMPKSQGAVPSLELFHQ